MDWRGVSIALCLRVCSPSLYRDTVPIFILMSLVAFFVVFSVVYTEMFGLFLGCLNLKEKRKNPRSFFFGLMMVQ